MEEGADGKRKRREIFAPFFSCGALKFLGGGGEQVDIKLSYARSNGKDYHQLSGELQGQIE